MVAYDGAFKATGRRYDRDTNTNQGLMANLLSSIA